MRLKMFGLMRVLAMVFAVTLVTVACTTKPTETNDRTSAIRAYADPATETLLQGISENDMAKYARDGNAEFKAAVTQEIFDALVPQIKSQYGDYESKEFLSTEDYQGYIIVHYKAKFTKGELGVRMVFDQDKKVAGQFFE